MNLAKHIRSKSSVAGVKPVLTIEIIQAAMKDDFSLLLKKGNKIVVKKYLFKHKNRNSIQKATVIKALNLILSIFK